MYAERKPYTKETEQRPQMCMASFSSEETRKDDVFEIWTPYQKNNGMKSRDYKTFRELFR